MCYEKDSAVTDIESICMPDQEITYSDDLVCESALG